jgi:hypothetical protein
MRLLYIRSGNVCAFPGCTQLVVNEKNLYVCETVHIEAAEPKGERYNPAQDDDERRAFENLMLMCHPHHVETDDVDKFPVRTMKEMKANHEKKFAGGWKQPDVEVTKVIEMMNSAYGKEELYFDWTTVLKPTPAASCAGINATLGWGLNKKELDGYRDSVNKFAETLSKVPAKTRSVLAAIVDRGEAVRGEKIEALIPEIEAAGKTGPEFLRPQFQILEKMGYGGVDVEGGRAAFALTSTLPGWPIWYDLKSYFEKKGDAAGGLRATLFELDFTRLD